VRREATDAVLAGNGSPSRRTRIVGRGAASVDGRKVPTAATLVASPSGAQSTTLRARRARVAVPSMAHDAALSDF
jgi:hypothetical protein